MSLFKLKYGVQLIFRGAVLARKSVMARPSVIRPNPHAMKSHEVRPRNENDEMRIPDTFRPKEIVDGQGLSFFQNLPTLSYI